MSAHEGRAIRCIAYTHTGKFVAGSDDSGQVRFFQGNSFVFLNQVQVRVDGRGGDKMHLPACPHAASEGTESASFPTGEGGGKG